MRELTGKKQCARLIQTEPVVAILFSSIKAEGGNTVICDGAAELWWFAALRNLLRWGLPRSARSVSHFVSPSLSSIKLGLAHSNSFHALIPLVSNSSSTFSSPYSRSLSLCPHPSRSSSTSILASRSRLLLLSALESAPLSFASTTRTTASSHAPRSSRIIHRLPFNNSYFTIFSRPSSQARDGRTDGHHRSFTSSHQSTIRASHRERRCKNATASRISLRVKFSSNFTSSHSLD